MLEFTDERGDIREAVRTVLTSHRELFTKFASYTGFECTDTSLKLCYEMPMSRGKLLTSIIAPIAEDCGFEMMTEYAGGIWNCTFRMNDVHVAAP